MFELTENEFMECEEAERRKHDDKVRELQNEKKEMKAYSEEILGISDIHKYSHKLFDAFEKLEFRTTFNKAIQAFYLERGLYVVRSDSMGKYQYTLVEARSEEMAIRKCM